MKPILLGFALLTVVSTLPAQDTHPITFETPVTSTQLTQWLHSGDPRLIAWSATLAVRDHNLAPVTQMPALLQTWNVFHGDTASPNPAQAAQRRATGAILDALILEQTPVPLPAIKAIAQSFPAQAAILINRLPLNQTQSTLHDWTYGGNGSFLARIASMMLAQSPHPDPTFVAETVAAAEENLQIVITAANHGSGSGFGPACGDSIGLPLAPGWPKVFVYDLQETDSPRASDSVLLELDGHRVVFHRYAENEGHGSCSFADPLVEAVTRHRLIAHWLGVKPHDMPWQPTESADIEWTNLADYQRQLGAIVAAHHAQLAATFDTLLKRGLLQPLPMYPVAGDQGLPKLSVTITCDIKPCPVDPSQ